MERKQRNTVIIITGDTLNDPYLNNCKQDSRLQIDCYVYGANREVCAGELKNNTQK